MCLPALECIHVKGSSQVSPELFLKFCSGRKTFSGIKRIFLVQIVTNFSLLIHALP